MIHTISKASLILALVGCAPIVVSGNSGGGSSTTTGAGGASSSSGVVASSTASSAAVTASSSTSVASSSSSSGALLPCSGPDTPMPGGACVPTDPACNTQHSACAARQTYDGASAFALRVVQLTFIQPTALSYGIGASALNGMLGISAPDCSYVGDAASWVLEFDGNAGKLTTGTAWSHDSGPFQMVNASFPNLDGTPVHIAPVTLDAPIDASCGFATPPIDLNWAIDPEPGTFLYFPLRQLRFHDVALSPDHNCVGRYNADGLDPANGCSTSNTLHAYVDGGQLDGFMSLEEADTVSVALLSMSLCVFLSTDPKTYGDQSQFKRCARDGNHHIVFQGDWCAATNQPATSSCADAVRVSGSFAAAGVAAN